MSLPATTKNHFYVGCIHSLCECDIVEFVCKAWQKLTTADKRCRLGEFRL